MALRAIDWYDNMQNVSSYDTMTVHVFTLQTSIHTSAPVETANARFDIFGNVEHRALG